jgi:3-hydroxybutyrate dehydrogenase
LQELEGKRAVITGSTQRLGLAVARRFASDGCDIVLHGLGDVEAIAALQRQIETDCSVRTLETTAYDITCNAVCPGTSATPIQEATLTLGSRPSISSAMPPNVCC